MLRGTLSTAKDLLAGVLETSGVLRRRVDRKLRGRVLVLMYHRVLPEHERDSFSAPGIIVTPETFDRHLRWIRTHLNPLTSAEFGDVLEGKCPTPDRACLVTFDDGWYDNYTNALPALIRHEVPALLFAATGFIGTADCFWQERLGRLLHTAWNAGPPGSQVLNCAGATIALNLPDSAARRQIRYAIDRVKLLTPTEIVTVVQQVEGSLREIGVAPPTDPGDDRFLSWTELQNLVASGHVTIGSHTVSHSPLPRLALDIAMTELSRSRAMLETKINSKVDWFAYPNGDYDATSAALVRASGYRGAFTTKDGTIAPGDDSFALCRVNMHEGATRTIGRFLARVAGTL